ncbi:MAG: hypothetical protein KatS3mg004_1042 [Bryobacteraceae bacterium]|nr:MAG: hypothetical protein KatS3mg004_1042 [Bryobacteraceae bacterium]
METSLIGGFAAGLGIAAAACLPLLRRAFHTRQLRIRLEIPPVGRRARLGFDLLGLSDPDGPQSARHEPGTLPEVPAPQFWIHERRAGRMAPALLASAGLHAVLAASAPEALLWLSRALDPQAVLVVHVEGAIRMPLTLQAPMARNAVMANPTRKVQRGRARAGRAGAGAPSARRLVEPAIPGPGRRTEDLPASPLPSAAAALEAPRPQRPYRVVAATTLLQPRRPAAQKEFVELPALAAWAGRMPDVPLVQAPGSPSPGLAQAAPPPRTPVLPLRSGAPVRAEPPRLEEPKLALPPPGIPADLTPLAAGLPGSGMPQIGEPVSVISISPMPLRPGETVEIPPVNQVGGGLEAGVPGGSGVGGAATRAQAAPGGSGSGLAGSRGGTNAGVSGGQAGPGAAGTGHGAGTDLPAGAGEGTGAGGAGGRGAAGRGLAAAGTGAGGGTAPLGTGTGTGSGLSPGNGLQGGGQGPGRGPGTGRTTGVAGQGEGAAVPLRLGSVTALMERRPDGAVVIHYPPDGNFDVIVVEGALPEAVSSLASRLACRPVYTAYLNVGAEREWMLNYCAAEKAVQAAQGMVVTLEDPPPLKAPYVLRAELPPPEEWKSAQYQAFHGFITGAGKMERVTAVRAAGNPAALLKLLPWWEFRPARRGSASVEIEVLLLIPPQRGP